jgi:hypothetical protein
MDVSKIEIALNCHALMVVGSVGDAIVIRGSQVEQNLNYRSKRNIRDMHYSIYCLESTGSTIAPSAF